MIVAINTNAIAIDPVSIQWVKKSTASILALDEYTARNRDDRYRHYGEQPHIVDGFFGKHGFKRREYDHQDSYLPTRLREQAQRSSSPRHARQDRNA